MAGFEVYEPNYKNFGKGGVGLYRTFLTSQLGKGGQDIQQFYRNQAYRGIGQQQSNAQMQARDSLNASGFGGNTPTGLDAALRSQIALQAPYGEADLSAREAGRRGMIQTGGALEQSKLNQASWYSTLMNNVLAAAALQAQQNAAGAQGGFNWGSMLSGLGGFAQGSGVGQATGAQAQ